MPHFRKQVQWMQTAQCCLPEEARPGQHEGVGGTGRSVTPWSHQQLGRRNAGQQIPPPLSANRGRQPAKPCTVPALLQAWTKPSFVSCMTRQTLPQAWWIISGFTLSSTLGEKMDGPKLPNRSFPLENPVPPTCSLHSTQPCYKGTVWGLWDGCRNPSCSTVQQRSAHLLMRGDKISPSAASNSFPLHGDRIDFHLQRKCEVLRHCRRGDCSSIDLVTNKYVQQVNRLCRLQKDK